MSMPTAAPVTKEDIESYQRDGFVRLEGFFSGDEMGVLRAGIDEAIAANRDRILGAENGGRSSQDYERVFNQMVNLWVDYPIVKNSMPSPATWRFATSVACRSNWWMPEKFRSMPTLSTEP